MVGSVHRTEGVGELTDWVVGFVGRSDDELICRSVVGEAVLSSQLDSTHEQNWLASKLSCRRQISCIPCDLCCPTNIFTVDNDLQFFFFGGYRRKSSTHEKYADLSLNDGVRGASPTRLLCQPFCTAIYSPPKGMQSALSAWPVPPVLTTANLAEIEAGRFKRNQPVPVVMNVAEEKG